MKKSEVRSQKSVGILLGIALAFALTGCASTGGNNTNEAPGGSTFRSVYKLNLHNGTLDFETPKDHSIGSLTATFNTNGFATITVSNLSATVDSNATSTANAANAAIAQIIAAQGAANAAIMAAAGNLLQSAGAAVGTAAGKAANTAVTGKP